MKRTFAWSFIYIFAPFFATDSQAQSDRFAYAVTDVTNKGSNWSAIRKLDLQTGEYSPVIFNNITGNTSDFDITSKKAIRPRVFKKKNTLFTEVLYSGVAAMAYDKWNNRLYFTPMSIDQLSYLDLTTMQLNYIINPSLTNLGSGQKDASKMITRMVIAPNGNGYALTNDGGALIQFTTDKQPRVNQLGALIDDPSNVVSIHNHATSYGGDMVADDEGNFYLITAKNNAFMINAATRNATHLGVVKNLPDGFTVNGMVVADDNKLLVSSAVDASGWYEVDPISLEAKQFEVASTVFRSSDLANSNFLKLETKNNTTYALSHLNDYNKIQLYPNPVTSNRFTLILPKIDRGESTIEVLDLTGRQVLQQKVRVNLEFPSQSIINLSPASAKGIYMIKVIGADKKLVFEQKLLVQ